MATVGTHIFNGICEKLYGADRELFKAQWEVVNTKRSATNYGIAWRCLPLNTVFSILHAPAQKGLVMKYPHVDRGDETSQISYFSDEGARTIAALQGKKLMGYRSDVYCDFINYLPGTDKYQKAEIGSIMFLGNLFASGEMDDISQLPDPAPAIFYHGWHKRDEWQSYGEGILVRLTDYEAKDAVNKSVFSGMPSFHYITNDCCDDYYLPTICYQ